MSPTVNKRKLSWNQGEDASIEAAMMAISSCLQESVGQNKTEIWPEKMFVINTVD